MKRNYDALGADNEKTSTAKKVLVWGTAAVALAGGGVAVKGHIDNVAQQERHAQNQEYSTRLNSAAGEFADIILSQYDKNTTVKMREVENGDLIGGLMGDDYKDGTVTIRYSDENPGRLDVSFSADVVGVYNNGHGLPIDVRQYATFESPYTGGIEADTEEISVQDLEKITDNATLTGISFNHMPTDKSVKGQGANFGVKLNSDTREFEAYSLGSPIGGPRVSEIITKTDDFNKSLIYQHDIEG